MMEKLFYEGCYTQEVGDALKSSEALPLVREISFKYGLKVLTPVKSQLGSDHKLHDAYLMVDKHGLATATIGTIKEESNVTQFCYRSPYFQKQRGSNRQDKETVRSAKLSALMATIKRSSAVPHDLGGRKAELVSSAVSQLEKSIGSSYKSHSLNNDEVHALLAYYLGETTNANIVALDRDKCIMQLDNLNKLDSIAQMKTEEINRFFSGGYFQFGMDEFGHLLVGKFKAVADSNRHITISAIEPFKRYVNPSECVDLAPLLTMIKLSFENTQYDKTKAGMPIMDGYSKDLDTVFYYDQRPTRYDCMWAFTPIGGIL